jgi:hypothetical protein
MQLKNAVAAVAVTTPKVRTLEEPLSASDMKRIKG